MKRLIFLFTLLVFIATGASAVEFRLGDLGTGNHPSLMASLSSEGFVPAYGFQKLGHIYEPVTEFSFYKEGTFGRVGFDSVWNPDVSFGVRSYINKWIGIETSYVWSYKKQTDRLRFASDGDGRVAVGIFASF